LQVATLHASFRCLAVIALSAKLRKLRSETVLLTGLLQTCAVWLSCVLRALNRSKEYALRISKIAVHFSARVVFITGVPGLGKGWVAVPAPVTAILNGWSFLHCTKFVDIASG
jgi:hypothetical protein